MLKLWKSFTRHARLTLPAPMSLHKVSVSPLVTFFSGEPCPLSKGAAPSLDESNVSLHVKGGFLGVFYCSSGLLDCTDTQPLHPSPLPAILQRALPSAHPDEVRDRRRRIAARMQEMRLLQQEQERSGQRASLSLLPRDIQGLLGSSQDAMLTSSDDGMGEMTFRNGLYGGPSGDRFLPSIFPFHSRMLVPLCLHPWTLRASVHPRILCPTLKALWWAALLE